MTKRNEYYLQLCSELHALGAKILPEHPAHSKESNTELLDKLAKLEADFAKNDDYINLGQDIITHIISHYPDITPHMHRDLLWFFGGDCLHYLGDDELERYQNIEELYYEQSAEDSNTSYRNIRAQQFGMH